jgi:hypothetical protein
MYNFILPLRFIVASPRSALLRRCTATIAWTDPPANISPESTRELHTYPVPWHVQKSAFVRSR